MESRKISLESLLRFYFRFDRVYNEKHKELAEKYYHSIRKREMFKIYSEKYNVEAKLGYINKLKTKTSFWMYVADLEIRKKGLRKANTPLHSMPDCEYMFYGMFMNCAAFMFGADSARLVLIHSCTAEMIEFRYKPKLAEELLDHYLLNFTEKEIVFEQQDIGDQIILDL